MQTKITCESCGSSIGEFNSSGFYVCSYCGTQYALSFSGSVYRKRQLTKAEYVLYLKKIATRLSEDERTPIDILNFLIIDSFKLITNDNKEIHFIYGYQNVKYTIVFDDLGIKKIEFPKNKTLELKKSELDKKSMIYFIGTIIALGLLSLIIDIGIVSGLSVLIILILLIRNLNTKNKLAEEEKLLKKSKLSEFFGKIDLNSIDEK